MCTARKNFLRYMYFIFHISRYMYFKIVTVVISIWRNYRQFFSIHFCNVLNNIHVSILYMQTRTFSFKERQETLKSWESVGQNQMRL